MKSIHTKGLMAAAALVAASGLADGSRVTSVPELVAKLNELNAKNDPSGEIVIAPGTYDVSGQAMRYYDGTTDYDSVSHLSVNRLTLRGESDDPAAVVIFGDRSNRLLYMVEGVLKNVTLSNGCATATSSGGAVWAKNDNSVLTNIAVRCCTATKYGGAGFNGKWQGCLFESNTAPSWGGGALYCGKAYGCTFHANSSGNGGALYATEAFDSFFTNNVSSSYGGAAFAGNLTRCVMIGNTGANGGAFYGNTFNNKAIGCAFSNNTATASGGAVISGSLTNCIFYGNKAGTSGGAGFNTILADCKVVCNTAETEGGAVAGGSSVLSFCTVVSNVAKTTHGGGISDCLASNTLFFANRALQYGGAGKGSTFVACKLHGNSAVLGGGAFNGTFKGGEIVGNTADRGGAIYNGSADGVQMISNRAMEVSGATYDVDLKDCRIAYNLVCGTNSAKGVEAAAIRGKTASGCLIEGNALLRGLANGGDTCCGYVAMSNCTVRNNYVEGGSCCGLYSGSLIGCTISNNVGGVQLYQPSFVVKCDIYEGAVRLNGPLVDSRIMNHTNGNVLATGDNPYASGHFLELRETVQGDFAATNCLFWGNNSGYRLFYGGYNTRRQQLVNCTIARNRTSMFVGHNNADDSKQIDCVNCIFAENVDETGAANDISHMWGHNYINCLNCMIGTNRPGQGLANPDVDTVPCTTAKFDESEGAPVGMIKRSSPARGSGLVMDWMQDANDIRGEGFPRLRDGLVDIGCYQCWTDPSGFLMLLR